MHWTRLKSGARSFIEVSHMDEVVRALGGIIHCIFMYISRNVNQKVDETATLA